MNNSITWEGLEYPLRNRSSDWYWAIGIIAVALSATFVIFSNYLFAILIIIGSMTLVMFAKRTPRLIRFEINEKGIISDKLFYPYDSLESFWIESGENGDRILFTCNHAFVQHVVFPLHDVSIDDVHSFLSSHLTEKEQFEPLSHRLMEYLGF